MAVSKSPNELRVLALKLKASLYHIFVLFHNDPAVNDRINRRRSGSGSLFPLPLSPKSKSSSESPTARQRSPAISLGTARTPPGLPIPTGNNQFYLNGSHSNGTATFLLPLQDYRCTLILPADPVQPRSPLFYRPPYPEKVSSSTTLTRLSARDPRLPRSTSPCGFASSRLASDPPFRRGRVRSLHLRLPPRSGAEP
jgi:hypothetical protein